MSDRTVSMLTGLASCVIVLSIGVFLGFTPRANAWLAYLIFAIVVLTAGIATAWHRL
jgi:hypothetical protein